MNYTIGQLAKLTGSTVRALHHHEQQGLLKPSSRTPAGYRRYSDADVLALHRILACRQLGMGLQDIAAYLGSQGPPLRELLAKQATKTRTDIARLQSLLSKLERLIAISRSREASALSTELLDLMNTMQALQKHYDTQELEELNAIRDKMSSHDLVAARGKLPSLLAAFAAACSRQADPSEAQVQALARQWLVLGQLAPASRPLAEKTRALLDRNEEVQAATGITPELKAYIDRAVTRIRAEG